MQFLGIERHLFQWLLDRRKRFGANSDHFECGRAEDETLARLHPAFLHFVPGKEQGIGCMRQPFDIDEIDFRLHPHVMPRNVSIPRDWQIDIRGTTDLVTSARQ